MFVVRFANLSLARYFTNPRVIAWLPALKGPLEPRLLTEILLFWASLKLSRDEILVSRDESLVSRDESLVSRDVILVSREGGNFERYSKSPLRQKLRKNVVNPHPEILRCLQIWGHSDCKLRISNTGFHDVE